MRLPIDLLQLGCLIIAEFASAAVYIMIFRLNLADEFQTNGPPIHAVVTLGICE
jgi:hypothetical protein